MWKLTIAVAAAFLGAACAHAPKDARLADYRIDGGREHIGRIYHYLRSNRDGTLPEHVYVFHKSSERIEV